MTKYGQGKKSCNNEEAIMSVWVALKLICILADEFLKFLKFHLPKFLTERHMQSVQAQIRLTLMPFHLEINA